MVIQPAHMRSFVDLRNVPSNHTCEYGPGIYVIVETVRPNVREVEIRSEIFVPYVKHKMKVTGTTQWTRAMKILPLKSLMGPIAVFPDLENKTPNAFLMVKRMSEWADGFSGFLMQPHTRLFSKQLLTGKEEEEIHHPTSILKTIPEAEVIKPAQAIKLQ